MEAVVPLRPASRARLSTGVAMGGLRVTEANLTKSKTNPQREESASAEPATVTPKGKLGALVALLLRPEGASLDVMQAATGWQAHSVRGAIAGSIKKKLGFAVTSEKSDAGRVYRIVKGAGA